MQFSLLFAAALSSPAFTFAHPSYPATDFFTWNPPGPSDVRGPCPMLNTLANHGFLPHSGYNISQADTVHALYTALNINQSAGELLFGKALTTNPDYPNATEFSLVDLRRHNILEHDASLSRGDYYFGNDYSFNQTIFDQTRSYWTSPRINVTQAAHARLARVHTSNATNPTFTLTSTGLKFSFGETSAYIIVLGDRVAGTVRRAWVEYLFENERLPLKLGWTPRKQEITGQDLVSMMKRVVNATEAAEEEKAMMVKREGLHAALDLA